MMKVKEFYIPSEETTSTKEGTLSDRLHINIDHNAKAGPKLIANIERSSPLLPLFNVIAEFIDCSLDDFMIMCRGVELSRDALMSDVFPKKQKGRIAHFRLVLHDQISIPAIYQRDESDDNFEADGKRTASKMDKSVNTINSENEDLDDLAFKDHIKNDTKERVLAPKHYARSKRNHFYIPRVPKAELEKNHLEKLVVVPSIESIPTSTPSDTCSTPVIVTFKVRTQPHISPIDITIRRSSLMNDALDKIAAVLEVDPKQLFCLHKGRIVKGSMTTLQAGLAPHEDHMTVLMSLRGKFKLPAPIRQTTEEAILEGSYIKPIVSSPMKETKMFDTYKLSSPPTSNPGSEDGSSSSKQAASYALIPSSPSLSILGVQHDTTVLLIANENQANNQTTVTKTSSNPYSNKYTLSLEGGAEPLTFVVPNNCSVKKMIRVYSKRMGVDPSKTALIYAGIKLKEGLFARDLGLTKDRVNVFQVIDV